MCQIDSLAQISAELRELRALAELLLERMHPPAILTSKQAMREANCGSATAFHRWAQKWRVIPSVHGRWPLHRIRRALEDDIPPERLGISLPTPCIGSVARLRTNPIEVADVDGRTIHVDAGGRAWLAVAVGLS